MASLNGRHNQQERGILVNQDKIRPKLTSLQRQEMSEQEKKAYNAERLKEYRNEYVSLYSKAVVSKKRAEATQQRQKEREEAMAFYKAHKAQQAIAV